MDDVGVLHSDAIAGSSSDLRIITHTEVQTTVSGYIVAIHTPRLKLSLASIVQLGDLENRG
jgi:hypothetical protein